ncbi:MAG: hypothetical protein AAGA27_08485 [Pseudomonadota bacterium]
MHQFSQSKGYFAKTDCIDAKLLAYYGDQVEITSDTLMDKNRLVLQEYSARKIQLKALITGGKQRQKLTYLSPKLLRSIKRTIKQLEQALKIICAELESYIEADKHLSEKRNLLKTVKGVGHEVATMCITNLRKRSEKYILAKVV